MSAGESEQEALDNIREAIELYLEAQIKEASDEDFHCVC